METPPTPRHAELLGTTIRRLLRRKARGKISKMLAKVRPEDVAVMLRGFTPSEVNGVFSILVSDFPQAASDVLISVEPQSRLAIFEQLEPRQVATLLDVAAVDDAVYLLDALPDALKEKVLEIVDLEERFADVQQHLAYDEDTAGRIMDTEFIALEESTTAGEAIDHLREIAHDVEMISYLYVLDKLGRLVGVTPLRQLLLAEPTATLGELMNTSVIKVSTETDQEEVAQLAARYDLLAIPVTDEEAHLVGIVTVDDILDVFKEEATEDFFKMAGTTEEELVYQDRAFKVAGIRLPWILFNLVGLFLAGYVVARFKNAFDVALLVGFVPVIMGMAGNIGSQTSTITVRGLATGRLSHDVGRIRHFLWQQLKVGVVLGVTCSLLATLGAYGLALAGPRILGGVAMVAGHIPILGLAVGTALFFTVQIASLTGVLIPVVFHRLRFDPAVASGPLVTTTNDFLAIVVYFTLTSTFFRLFGA